jgi:PBP1b-binding outer membrane lipoprotein LpoB
MKKLFGFIFLISFLVSCSQKAVITEEVSKKASLEDIAKNNFKAGYKILYNRNKSFAAIYDETKKEGDDYPTMKIMLFDTQNNTIVWGKKAYNGKVQWDGKNKLLADYYINGKKNTVIYNTKTKEISYIQ